jgi:DNA-binding CsgD family transcriptional regulator
MLPSDHERRVVPALPDLPLSVLTRRECEVALLIAAGLSNKQIAVRLAITAGTAGNHVGHIMRVLGATNRSQVAVWASERDRVGDRCRP